MDCQPSSAGRVLAPRATSALRSKVAWNQSAEIPAASEESSHAGGVWVDDTPGKPTLGIVVFAFAGDVLAELGPHGGMPFSALLQ
jgi:hypothetical protein